MSGIIYIIFFEMNVYENNLDLFDCKITNIMKAQSLKVTETPASLVLSKVTESILKKMEESITSENFMLLFPLMTSQILHL